MAYVRYKTAPTSLYKMIDGELVKEKFHTQEEVDQAWEDGWFGPRTLHDGKPKKIKRDPVEVPTAMPLSKAEWTVTQLKKLLRTDPRYTTFKTNLRRSKKEIRFKLLTFEQENEIL